MWAVFRRRLALLICPELALPSPDRPGGTAGIERGSPVAQAGHLITLAQRLAQHGGVTHFAISMRATGKGDFFARLMRGRDCRTATAARLLAWFDANWPADLEWPADIPRPKKEAA